MTETPAPSGRQYEIRHGNQAATVVEVGGGLRSYTVGGVDVLDGYGRDEMCVGAKGQTLAPWPNRIEDGSYSFDGEDLELPLTEAEAHNAIHGLVRWANWVPVEPAATEANPQSGPVGSNRCALAHRLHPSPGYPFTLDVRNVYTLDDDGLTVRTVATNAGARRCPYGLGFHPYLRVGTALIDDAVLTIRSATRTETNDRGIPTGWKPVDGTTYDFRSPRAIGGEAIDTTYADLERDADGRAEVVLAAPDGGRSVSLWLDEAFGYLELFTGDTLPASTRRTGLGVEPMTCPPNAFRTGQGLLVLEPGQSVVTTWGVRTRGF